MLDNRFVLLQDGDTKAVIDKLGAQIVGLKVDGLPILYEGAMMSNNGKSPRWGKSAPNLFPNPGPIGKENPKWGELGTKKVVKSNGDEETRIKYIINGGIYEMGQHGFIKDAIFEEVGVRNDYCVLETHANSSTADLFPYDFDYMALFDVKNGGHVSYQTTCVNLDTTPMPGGMGWHPAFVLHDKPQAYKVVFKNLECTEDCPLLIKNENGERTIKEFDGEYLVNSPKATTITGIKSVDAVIVYTDKNGKEIPYLTVHSNEPYLLLWSRKDDRGEPEFISIEAWNQQPRILSQVTTSDKIRDIEGAVIVEPKEESTLKVNLSINPEYVKIFSKSNEYER